MRKALIAVTLVGALVLAGVAGAAPDDVINVTSNAPKGGKKKKPKPVGPQFTMETSGGPGLRAENPVDLIWWWDGIREKSKKFPTCTAEEINQAQSDSVCSKKSLIATGDTLAQLGPVGNRASNVDCIKNINLYNGGNRKIVWFAFGPAAQCAGVAYLPPFVGKWQKKDGAAQAKTTLPDNIRQPLPGVEGGFTTLSFQFEKLKKVKGKHKSKKLKKKSKKAKKQGNAKKARKLKKKSKKAKKKFGLLESVGCKGKREFHYERTTISGDDDTVSTVAGKC